MGFLASMATLECSKSLPERVTIIHWPICRLTASSIALFSLAVGFQGPGGRVNQQAAQL